MKAQVIMPKQFPEISRMAEAVIFTRRPTQMDFLRVIKEAPWVKTLVVCESTQKHMGPNIRKICEVMNVALVHKNLIWGQKKHLNGSLLDIDLKEDKKV